MAKIIVVIEVGAERGVVAVHALDQRDRAVALQRVGARDRAQLAHPRRGVDAVAGDVAHDDAEAPAGQRDRVVPVAADARAAPARGDVRGQRHARDRRQALGQQRALQGGGDAPVAFVLQLDEHLVGVAVDVAHRDDVDDHRHRRALGIERVRGSRARRRRRRRPRRRGAR